MEGGARDQVLHRTRVTESGPGDRPQLVRGVVLCTHSLVLAALPEARNYELGEWVLRPIEYDELEITWHLFLDAPQRSPRRVGLCGRSAEPRGLRSMFATA